MTSIHDPADTCAEIGCQWGASGNRLYRNAGERRFDDHTDLAGVREGGWGWGAAALDYDNDGDLDLVMTNGQNYPFAGGIEAAFHDDPMRLWRNDGSGRFSEVSADAGLDETRAGKGLLHFDYDRDGDLDLFVVNNGETPALYRNDGGSQNDWLRVRVEGRRSNRQGIGARVRLTARRGGPTQTREISGGSHFLAQSEPAAWFGLGTLQERRIYEVRVEWPASGAVRVRHWVPKNRVLVVREPRRRRRAGDDACSRTPPWSAPWMQPVARGAGSNGTRFISTGNDFLNLREGFPCRIFGPAGGYLK